MITNPPLRSSSCRPFCSISLSESFVFLFSLELYDFGYASYQDLNFLAQFRVLQSWRHYIIYKILQETCSK